MDARDEWFNVSDLVKQTTLLQLSALAHNRYAGRWTEYVMNSRN